MSLTPVSQDLRQAPHRTRRRVRIWLLASIAVLTAFPGACASGPHRELGPVTPPVRLWSPPLTYPPAMFVAGVEGEVLLQALVDSTGHVVPSSVRVVRSSNSAFDAPAAAMLRGTRFRPARQGGRPVNALVEVPVDFALAGAEIDSAAAVQALSRAERLVRRGRFDEATAAFTAAQTADPRLSSSPSFWFPLCWYGTLWDHAAEVLGACDELVALVPGGISARRARGMARAVTGDLAGALDDFEAALRGPIDPAAARLFEEWIGELRAGRNPVTTSVLESLRAPRGTGGGFS